MHMPNELLNPPVAGGTIAVAAGAIANAAARFRRQFGERSIPVLGAVTAFVFAAQMLNFPILAGTSGHLAGGPLLAILFGPHAACLAMSAILIVQCLVFQDGGLLALGANILNMGVIGVYVGYAVYRLVLGAKTESASPLRCYGAAFAAAWVGVVTASACVPIEAALSGVTAVPFLVFLAAMLGVHALIGIVEGAVTAVVVALVHRARPDMVELAKLGAVSRPVAGVVGAFILAAIIAGGFFAHFASSHPDGLEWVMEERQVLTEQAAFAYEDAPAPALLPNYTFADVEADSSVEAAGITISGVVGSMITMLVIIVLALAARAVGSSRTGGSGGIGVLHE